MNNSDNAFVYAFCRFCRRFIRECLAYRAQYDRLFGYQYRLKVTVLLNPRVLIEPVSRTRLRM